MKIELSPIVANQLLALTLAADNKEFSGFGFAERNNGDLQVYEFVLLDIGSSVFTEIPTEKILELGQRKDSDRMKVWIHRHPIGNGTAGAHNWSGRDNKTIDKTPLGSPVELMDWSASIVITPKGWVGRIDNHNTNKTVHVDVHPVIKDYFLEVEAIKNAKVKVVTVLDQRKRKKKSKFRKLAGNVMDYIGDAVTKSDPLEEYQYLLDDSYDELFDEFGLSDEEYWDHKKKKWVKVR